MAGPALMNGFAAMGDAFIRSYQTESDRLRQQARQDAEAQWQNELRGRQRKDWAQEDSFRRALASAVSTPEPTTDLTSHAASKAAGGIAVGDQGGAVANAGSALRGYPGTDSPAPAANSGWHNRMMRVSDAIAHLDPKQAMEIRDSAMRSRSNEIKLNREEQDEVDRHYNNLLTEAVDSGPVWYEGAASFFKDVLNTDVVPELSKDGQKVSLYKIEPDGSRKLGGTFSSGSKGAFEWLNKSMRQDASVKLAALTKNMEYERARADKAADREADLAGRERLEGLKQRERVDATAKPPTGYRFTADGSLEAIPGGPAAIKSGQADDKQVARSRAAVAQANRVIGAIDAATKQVGALSAGAGGAVMAKLPGTGATDLRANLETVKANLGFAELQAMRDASPTGGALGAIAVQELIALQSTVASLDASQSPSQLRANLGKVRGHYQRWLEATQEAARQSSAVPQAQAFSGPGSYANEGQLRAAASGDMGIDPASVRREIERSKSDLNYIKDEPSRQMVLDHISNLERQLSGQGPTRAAPMTSLPQGARQIGTSGGRPVYELPDGQRFIQQ